MTQIAAKTQAPKALQSARARVCAAGSLLLLFLQGCNALERATSASRNLTDYLSNSVPQQEVAQGRNYANTYVRFNHVDFYTLLDPNSNHCAGDLRYYNSPYTLDSNGSPSRLPASVGGASESTRPAYLRNISVDLTDSNTLHPSNAAYSCSYGAGNGVPPTSACSTFDYGAIHGVSTSLAGTLVFFGGISGSPDVTQPLSLRCGYISSSSYNTCSTGLYALSVETLPASAAGSSLAPGLTSASAPISSWADLDTSTSPATPRGAAGGTLIQNPDAGKLLLFAGSAPALITQPTGVASDTNETWIFDLTKLTWEQVPSVLQSALEISTMPDCTAFTGCSTNQSSNFENSSKAPGGRAAFGYLAVPNMALGALSTPAAAAMVTLTATQIDSTDRIITAGGIRGNNGFGSLVYSLDTNRFNPTFGPEYMDRLDESNPAFTYVAQWLDSSPFTLLNTSVQGNAATVGQPAVLPLFTYNNAASTPWVGFTMAPTLQTVSAGIDIGIFLTTGGLAGTSTESFTGMVSNGYSGGITTFSNRAAYGGHDASDPRSFQIIPTYSLVHDPFPAVNPNRGEFQFPLDERKLTEDATPDADFSSSFPKFVGGTLLPGLNLATKDFVFFGGVNCRDYLVKSGLDTCPNSSSAIYYNDRSKYWRTNPGADEFDTATPTPDSGNFTASRPAGSPPTDRAGMAAARGVDLGGNPYIVAWGGIKDALSSGNHIGYVSQLVADQDLWILASNAGTPTWTKIDLDTVSPRPRNAANATMVFSHVTKKFYIFGGYESDPVAKVRNDIWELGFSANCGASGTCSVANVAFKQLNLTNGSTCFPNCTDPPARRSHRMVEVNYNHTAPLADINPGADCSTSAPCSFGIFMEGGTGDGVTTLGDRWMFDPTANGDRGHWQRVDDLPPRRSSSGSHVTISDARVNDTQKYAVVFGGETGLSITTESTNSYIPPTLGDTLTFNFSTGTWSRVRLLGLGVDYNQVASQHPSVSDTNMDFTRSEIRQLFHARPNDYAAANATTKAFLAQMQVLSPPPIAGAVSVTRTRSGPSSSGATDLKIPEVYTFGGRLKTGKLNPLSKMYKFCLGSTGETMFERLTPDGQAIPAAVPGNGDGECDAAEASLLATDGLPVCTMSTACDAYDPANNPNSESPKLSPPVGRWLYRVPTAVAGYTGSYLGGGAYDSKRDRILLTGGVDSATDDAVTGSVNALGGNSADFPVLEYTPPVTSLVFFTTASATASDNQGEWNARSACAGSTVPSPRYGHSMSYDALHDQVLVVGGYDMTATVLTDSTTGGPEVWKGQRDDNAATPCYTWTQISTFGNSSGSASIPTSGLGAVASTFIQSKSYNTGFYTLQDSACTKAGPVQTADPATNRLLAGGVYFDLDRSELGPGEDLLLNLTFIPFSEEQVRGDGRNYETQDRAFFRIHLLSTGQNKSQLQSALQPRHLASSDTNNYPKVVDTLSVLSPADGVLRSEQIHIPISTDASIDRIRIERYSGSGILIDAKIYRMGYR